MARIALFYKYWKHSKCCRTRVREKTNGKRIKISRKESWGLYKLVRSHS